MIAIYLKEGHIVIMSHAHVVIRMGHHPLHFQFHSKIGVRVSPSYTQLYRPSSHISMTKIAKRVSRSWHERGTGRELTLESYSLAHAMGCCKNPLIGDQNSCTVEDLFGPAEKGCQEWPVARCNLHATHDSRLHPRIPVHCPPSTASYAIGHVALTGSVGSNDKR